ncbi:hypothetical protein OG453_42220 [Streptomyces sp. NBC_01381]|uniref:hypothetical protein n=1 Tax=Streptomyces sp. NBC_01381 TaxID=2903845 RepID=UPI002259F81E|nr:hypothetical protein [Streptomyces sp. NBC_01381]MCX4673178.1 hypothetical protein [Streptomyces sp. NBC_01381]
MTTFPTGPTIDDGGLLTALGGCTVLDCRVRVVRTDGWSWGPEASELARGAVAMLSRLLETYLAGALHRGLPLPLSGTGQLPFPRPGLVPQDIEVTVPVHIRSSATLDEFHVAAALAADQSGTSGSRPDAAELLRRGHASPAVLGVMSPAHAAGSEPGAERGTPTDADAGAPPRSGPLVPPAPSVFDRDRVLVGLLNEACACGAFDTVLAGLPHDALLLLLSALDAAASRTAPESGPQRDPETPVPGTSGASPRATDGSGHPDPGDLAVALLAALHRMPHERTDITRAATGLEIDPRTAQSDHPAPIVGRSQEHQAGSAPSPGRAQQHHTGPASGTVTDTDRVLPFLLLPPLHDRCYLEALAAVLTGGGAQAADGAAFAGCLAHKVLPPPAHGWLRSSQDAHAVAVFAGTAPTEPGTGATAPDLERRIGPLLALLDTRLGLQAAQGHTATSPLLLRVVAPDRLLLLDVDGLYPVWEAQQPAELLRPWELAGTPVVLLPARADVPTAAGLTLALDELGMGFVTDLPPARGERLRRVPGPRRCWTNIGAPIHSRSRPDDDALVGAARRLTYEASRAARFDEALIELRPAVRAGQAPAVERTTTLAAAVALADLAWTLWSEHEAADPVYALERFADLGARVAFHDSTVEVRLPLGARHADLYRHRLLADVPDVPWFGGRTVVFTGG